MKNYIVEKRMRNSTDGYMCVIVEGETHSNRLVLSSEIQFFTTEGGYSYNHPYEVALQNANAICNGLNALEKIRAGEKRLIVNHSDYLLNPTSNE